MLNVGKIEEGFVLDHIEAGKSLSIYHHLQLDKLDCTVAIIKNAKSNKMGKKDILKVECDIDTLNLDVLAFIDHNITVNIIKDGEIVECKYVDLKFNLDERICDGFYYAGVIKYFIRILSHPDVLDNPPDTIEQDIP